MYCSRPDSGFFGQSQTSVLKPVPKGEQKKKKKQGCRSRLFWLEPEPFFWSGSYSYSSVNILFLRDPKYDYDYDDYDYDDYDYDDYQYDDYDYG